MILVTVLTLSGREQDPRSDPRSDLRSIAVISFKGSIAAAILIFL